jgi:hypothetical protein
MGGAKKKKLKKLWNSDMIKTCGHEMISPLKIFINNMLKMILVTKL